MSDDLEFSKVKEELDAQNETEPAQTEIAPNPETFECNYSISSNISASLNNKNGVDNAQIDTAQNVDKRINNNAENAQNSVQTTENDKNVAQNDNNTAKVVNNTAQNVDNSNSKKKKNHKIMMKIIPKSPKQSHLCICTCTQNIVCLTVSRESTKLWI